MSPLARWRTKFVTLLRQQALGAIALFVALGGTSYAVATGSIDGREIKNNTVRGTDIRNNSVRGTDIRDKSLLAKDFKPGQIPAGPRGTTGTQGPQGVKGDKGERGPSFGDGKQASSVNVPQCAGDTLLTSYTLTLTVPSRVFVSGQAYYQKFTTDRPETPSIQVELRDAGDTNTLARSAQMLAGSLSTAAGTSTRDPMTTAGILMVPATSGPDTTPFVAAPGTYVLKLFGAASGNCSAAASVSMGGISLNHIVLGTAP